ncbi:MAG: hypothetical protein JXA97_03735 [Anaerolineales bacterium]|nr:hypothetical protein [Anaerolineales bacterium]
MINLIRAEWKKLLGNRMLASFTVWLYPTGLGAFVLVMSIIHLLGGETYQELGGNWNEPMLSAWNIITQFPDASFGRLPLLAFMAVMSAGEYEWGTWKNILPRNRRWAILVAKILTMALVMVFSIGLTSIISGPVRYAAANLIGIQTAQPLSSSDLASFLSAYALEAGIAFIQSLFLAYFAVFAALLTRTIIGSLLLSFGFSFLEMLSPLILMLFGRILKVPGLVNGYIFFPSYLLGNLRSWILNGVYLNTALMDFTRNLNPSSTILLLAAVLIGAASLCIWMFNRQDITA